MSTITIRQASKVFAPSVHALNDVSLEIAQGSFVAVLGPSGAGKSTLLRSINSLETLTSGEILIDDVPVRKNNLQKIRKQVGMVFQKFCLVNRLNVMTNVLTGRLAHLGWLARLGSYFYLFHKAEYERAFEAIQSVGLEDKTWMRADRLSGGQQQRVGIARVLAQHARVILADEPVASLDPVTGEQIMTILRDICRMQNITVIVNLHPIELARTFAQRIIGMNQGRIVFDGPVTALTEEQVANIYQGAGTTHQNTDSASDHYNVTNELQHPGEQKTNSALKLATDTTP